MCALNMFLDLGEMSQPHYLWMDVSYRSAQLCSNHGQEAVHLLAYYLHF